MMNNLLRDIIKVGDVAVFIDNIIVEIETKKEYDNIVKKNIKKNSKKWFVCKTRKICIKD